MSETALNASLRRSQALAPERAFADDAAVQVPPGFAEELRTMAPSSFAVENPVPAPIPSPGGERAAASRSVASGAAPAAVHSTPPVQAAPPERSTPPERNDAAGSGVGGGAVREWVLEPGQFTSLPERAIQKLWFELRTWSWKSLAVVPTVAGASELDIAEKLVIVGVANTNRRMALISAEGATIADTDRVIAMVRAAEQRGDRVIVATDAVVDNPAAAPIIRAINGTVLSVRLGDSHKTDVEQSVATINRNRIIGMITRT